MSGLAGILTFDGQPVQPIQLQTMVEALAHRGPDGCHTRFLGQAGLGYLAMHSTPESVEAPQPWSDETGELWVVFDGRLDNQTELKYAARACGLKIRNASDVELVLRTYQAAGTGFAERLLGDFALLIWNARTRCLIGARDVAAERPFFYSRVGTTVFVASEIHALLTQPEISSDPNETIVAEHLADQVRTTDKTLFRSIHKLPPAHLFMATSDGIEVKRYWEINPDHEIRYRDENQYAEHLRELLEKAVRCRLRSSGPVAVDLSGGLDSSSIATMIEDLRRRGVPIPQGIEYISMVFPNQPCDESHWISAVENKIPLISNRVGPTLLESSRCRGQASFYKDLPDYPNGMMAEGLRNLARARGCRVRLTGLGGDEWLAGSARHLTDHLRRMQFFRLARQLAADARLLDTSKIRLLRHTIGQLTPKPLRTLQRTVRRLDPVPKWLGPRLREQRDFVDTLHRTTDASRYRCHAQADITALLDNGFAIHRAEMEERAAAASGLVLREPFSDRRIIEFGLAIPEEQRWLGRFRKRVIRTAMADLLPTEIQFRTDKAEFSSVIVDALRTAEPEIFLSPRCAEAGWVDAAQVVRMYEEFKKRCDFHSPAKHPHLWPLWKILGIEIWYQSVYNENIGAYRR